MAMTQPVPGVSRKLINRCFPRDDQKHQNGWMTFPTQRAKCRGVIQRLGFRSEFAWHKKHATHARKTRRTSQKCRTSSPATCARSTLIGPGFGTRAERQRTAHAQNRAQAGWNSLLLLHFVLWINEGSTHFVPLSFVFFSLCNCKW